MTVDFSAVTGIGEAFFSDPLAAGRIPPLPPPAVLEVPLACSLPPLGWSSLICGLAESSLILCFAGPSSLLPLKLRTRVEKVTRVLFGRGIGRGLPHLYRKDPSTRRHGISALQATFVDYWYSQQTLCSEERALTLRSPSIAPGEKQNDPA